MEYIEKNNGIVRSKLKEAFTLIELMIAMVIIGLIIGGASYGFITYQERARTQNAQALLRNLRTSVLLYEQDTGQYPTRLQDLLKDPGIESWRGPYLDKKQVPKDPWGKPFVYQQTPEDEHPYQLYSYGGSKGKQEPKSRRLSAWNV